MEQINLNRPELWPQPTPFPARAMALALAALVLAGLGLYAYQAYRLEGQRAELAQVRAERDRVEKRLKAAEAAHQNRLQALEELEDRVAGLDRRIALFRRAEAGLAKRLAAAGSKGEMARGLGRARAALDGVWLTRFRLDGVAPVRVRLEGKALTPEAVPRFLRAVAAEEIFAGGFFRDFQAKTPEEGAPDSEERVLTFHSEAAFAVAAEDGS